MKPPLFPGRPRKNDGIFIYGALQPKPFVFVYEQSLIEVVHGPSCKPQQEIDTDNCMLDSVPVVERRGGGGTVVLAPGVVITIIIGMRRGETSGAFFDKIHHGMINVFKNQGFDNIEMKGISDLAIGDKKILGSSLYLGSNPRMYYYQSSLMVQSDISLLSRYLRHPLREPDYRQKRNHEGFCTTLKDSGVDISPEKICQLFRSELPLYL